ncbi:hypothetical protein J3R83DRAFT_11267 [Lanmaoa asiatica]|nr:hypothetical protein J3R83DRAFT_11267 [Lanmaoa asiatica]
MQPDTPVDADDIDDDDGHLAALSPANDFTLPVDVYRTTSVSAPYAPFPRSQSSPPPPNPRPPRPPSTTPPTTTASPPTSPTAPLPPLPGVPTSSLPVSPRPSTPIVVDTRPVAAYHASHLIDSVNIAIPSLILKRCRKPGSGFQSLAALRQFITSDQGKHRWDTLPSSTSWDGEVVIVHGEETDDSEIDNLQVTAWALLSVISSLLGPSRVHYLRGGIAAAQSHPTLRNNLITQSLHPPDPDDPAPQLKSTKSKGLFHLNTSAPTQSHFEIDQPMPSPLPIMPTTTSDQLSDTNGSPPPSQLSFRRPAPPRRPSVPNITRISTNGGCEQQLSPPRLHIRTAPTRSATLPITPSQLSASPNGNTLYLPPQSPSHLNLLHSNHTPPSSSPRWTTSPAEFLPPPSPRFTRPTPPRTPDTPLCIPHPTPSPSTARPGDLQTASTEGEFPTFTVSMILPHFLYLGPELTLPEHVQELKSLGIKRILNIAAECDDDHGLNLRENFERYVRIPMRDTVEEDQITMGLKEACEILGRAVFLYVLFFPIEIGIMKQVYSERAPTCIARRGKSRSVTAVMAYLIHANHWTLSRAYAYVLERRKGISPNIGFVSELMTFEEQELGGKSIGVVPVTPGQGDGGGDPQTNYAYAAQSRRPGHARESLPPMVTVQDSDDAGEVAMGQDMEIKDKEGRYRHMRRAPVDENTLQPMRRVSKAGLESGF